MSAGPRREFKSYSAHTMAYPTWLLVIGSILSSVALVVVNKQIFHEGFGFVFTLSTFHFIVTSGLLQLMARLFGAFQIVYLPFWTNLMVATFGVGSISLMNFSLKFNSIGFYQMLKLCIVPCCLLINLITYGETTTRKIVGALTLVLAGVGVATVTDLEFNMIGMLFGVGAVLTTAQYQIWQGKKAKEAGLTSTQLANSVSLLQIFVGMSMALALESRELMEKAQSGAFQGYKLPAMIALSCLLAVSVNVHSFALIGKTSAVTFQVVGHGKTCLILLSGYVMHVQAGKPLSELYKNVVGVVIALLGVALYSNLKLAGDSSDWCDMLLPRPILALFQSPEAVERPSSADYVAVSAAEKEGTVLEKEIPLEDVEMAVKSSLEK